MFFNLICLILTQTIRKSCVLRIVYKEYVPYIPVIKVQKFSNIGGF